MLKVVGASWLQTKIICYGLASLVVLSILTLILGEFEGKEDDGNFAATVFWDPMSKQFHIEFWGQGNDLSELPRGAARAYFRQDVYTTGWSHLEIETDESYPDFVQAQAAGYLEGALTWQQIYSHYINLIDKPCRGDMEKVCERLRDHLELAVAADNKRVAEFEDDDPFWHQVGLFYHQIRGMMIGYNQGVRRTQKDECEIQEEGDFYWLNYYSDLYELKKHLNISIDNVELDDQLPGSASSYIRLVNDSKTAKRKLFVAHNAAGSYNSMLRILKRYKMSYRMTSSVDSPIVPGVTIEMSSYPAAISSHDHLYIVSGDNNKHLLSVIGTTLHNFNPSIWKFVDVIDQVSISPRALAANRLALNASDWSHYLARSNSGTGSNQWLVADFGRLDEAHVCNGTDIYDERHTSYVHKMREFKHTIVRKTRPCGGSGLIVLVEQVPSRTHAADLSDTLLDRNHITTYGLPFFPDISELTNHTEMEKKYGTTFSIHLNPKAQFFNHHSANATDIPAIMALMRSTNVTNVTDIPVNKDVCSQQVLLAEKLLCHGRERHYWFSLGVRGDLLEENGVPFGVIDTKVFSANGEGKVLEFDAISGPSFTQVRKPKPTPRPIEFHNKATVIHIPPPAENQVKEIEEDKSKIKPFDWTRTRFNSTFHEALPEVFNFTTLSTTWAW